MRPRITLIFALLAALLLPNISAVTQEDKLEVIASYSILADVVTNIAGDHIELTTLIPTGADPHGFQPSPRDLTPLSEADVIFVNGAGFEETLLEVIAGAAADVPIVEISSCVGIIPIGASGHMHEDDEHMRDDDDHADEDDDDHGHDHDDDDHADEDDDDHGHDHDDDDHADEDDDHGHDYDDDDHADEDEDDHGHDHDDDDHADEDDDDHGHDHDDDDHADEDDDEHMHDDMHSHCDDHDAEFAQVIGDDEDAHEHGSVLGRLEDIECGGHGHGHGHEDEAHAHEEGACDPHVWMDPHNIIYWSLMVRDVLSELDPGHAADYAAAAEDYIGELIALEEEFMLPLLETLPVEKRILVTSHDSLGYLAASFDFVIIGTVIPGASTQVEPSASDVSALIDLVKETGVAAIFGETIVNTAVLETIAAETGAELAVIYTGTLSVDGPASTYLDYIRYNLTTIVEALGAGG